jgi:hypothetical protein
MRSVQEGLAGGTPTENFGLTWGVVMRGKNGDCGDEEEFQVRDETI